MVSGPRSSRRVDSTYDDYAECIRRADSLDALTALKQAIQRYYSPDHGDRGTLIGEIACRQLELLRDRLGGRRDV